MDDEAVPGNSDPNVSHSSDSEDEIIQATENIEHTLIARSSSPSSGEPDRTPGVHDLEGENHEITTEEVKYEVHLDTDYHTKEQTSYVITTETKEIYEKREVSSAENIIDEQITSTNVVIEDKELYHRSSSEEVELLENQISLETHLVNDDENSHHVTTRSSGHVTTQRRSQDQQSSDEESHDHQTSTDHTTLTLTRTEDNDVITTEAHDRRSSSEEEMRDRKDSRDSVFSDKLEDVVDRMEEVDGGKVEYKLTGESLSESFSLPEYLVARPDDFVSRTDDSVSRRDDLLTRRDERRRPSSEGRGAPPISPGTSGKFTLRSSRHADPLHFIHRIREQSEDFDPALEELITVIRSTDTMAQIEEDSKQALHSLITSELVRQFEQAKEHGELPSPSRPPPDIFLEQPLSLKEELADREEEKAKDRLYSGSLEELELPHDKSQIPLDHAASKQRVQLRQRGSLAKRRKPSRATVRTTGFTEKKGPALTINGHDSSSSSSEPSTPEILSPGVSTDFLPPGGSMGERVAIDSSTNIAMSTAAQGSVLGGKTFHGIKTALVEPGLVESSRQRLRSVPPISLPTNQKHPSLDEEPTPSTPPWLLEMRLRRTNRPPKGEIEKLKQETEPERPAWMKDALAKKKRVETHSKSQSSMEDDKEDSPSVNVAPWLQEITLRHGTRNQPIVTHKDVTNNVNHLIADSSRSESNKQHIQEVTEVSVVSVEVDGESHVTSDTHRLQPALPKNIIHPHESISSPSKPTDQECEPAWKAEVAMRKKNKSYIVANKPVQPLRLGEVPQWKKDLLEKTKHRRVSEGAEPIEGSRGSEDHTETETSLPPWKQEMALRKKRSSDIFPRSVNVIKASEGMGPEPEEEPEWARLVARRRDKLAKSGLISSSDDASSSAE